MSKSYSPYLFFGKPGKTSEDAENFYVDIFKNQSSVNFDL